MSWELNNNPYLYNSGSEKKWVMTISQFLFVVKGLLFKVFRLSLRSIPQRANTFGHKTIYCPLSKSVHLSMTHTYFTTVLQCSVYFGTYRFNLFKIWFLKTIPFHECDIFFFIIKNSFYFGRIIDILCTLKESWSFLLVCRFLQLTGNKNCLHLISQFSRCSSNSSTFFLFDQQK